MADGSGVSLKTCTKCGETKPETEFHLFTDKRRGVTGTRWHCKVCAVRAATQWADVNRDRLRKRENSYYNTVQKLDPFFMEKKRSSARATSRKARSRPGPKAQISAYMKAKRLENIAFSLVKGARSRALAKRLQFDLSREWADTKYTGFCELTGIAFQIGDGRQHAYSPSIDRIEPLQGYTQGNCRFVLSAVNSLKGAGSDSDMFQIAKALVNFRGND